MSVRTGSLVTAPIRIHDDSIPYPIAFQEEINGGAHAGIALTDRNALALWYRAWGMTFTVYNDGANNGRYVLTYGFFSTNLADNQNWIKEASGSTSNVKIIGSGITNTGTIAIPGNSMLYSILIIASGNITAVGAGLSAGMDDLVMFQPLPTGANNFHKGIYFTDPTTIYFTGVNPVALCSAVIFTF